MTTPPPPAGWFPDPDGSGGQRYWDGSNWTEHRAPGIAPTRGPSEPPSPPGTSDIDEPTAVVRTRPAGGAHRAPEPDDVPEPVPGSLDQPTMRVPLPTIPPAEPSEPRESSEPSQSEPSEPSDTERPAPSLTEPSGPSFAEPSSPSYSEPVTPSYGEPAAAFTDTPTPPELPRLGPFPSAAAEPRPQDDNRKLIITFSAVCAGLFAILLLVLVYAFFIHEDDTIQIGAQDTPTTSSEPATTAPSSEETTTEATETESPTASAGAEASDGPLSFTVHGYEVGDSVTSPDAPVEKAAQGDFVAVHMTVMNTSDAPATFLGTLQKLNAAGTVYNIDDEASFYLGGGLAEINPGDSVDLSVAFDVPPGTVPESIDLHGDPMSAGVQVPLA